MVNCARGGIYDEAALAEAIKEGRVAGAAIDVYTSEPPVDRSLIDLPQTIVTPHLGASTKEAQENVAVDVAVEVIKVLKGEPFKNAVNLPPLRPEVRAALEPYFGLADALGKFLAQFLPPQIKKVDISYQGQVSQQETSYLSMLFIKGLLQASLAEEVNQVNAFFIAKERGLKINENKSLESGVYSSLIRVEVKVDDEIYTVSGTVNEKNEARIVEINGYYFEIALSGNMIIIDHTDQPGVIGEIGTILGASGVNIGAMQVGRKQPGGIAIMVLSVDSPIDSGLIKKIEKANTVTRARAISF